MLHAVQRRPLVAAAAKALAVACSYRHTLGNL
jgi:hypothetical protein